jgi:hypothetical protein
MEAIITRHSDGEVIRLKGTPDEVCRQALALFPWAKHHPLRDDHNHHDVRHVLARIGEAQNLSVEVEA